MSFRPADAGLILDKIWRALKPGGMLLLEPQDFGAVQRAYQMPPIWRTARQGLFSDKPYLYLQENFWDDRTRTVTSRYWVVDAETARRRPLRADHSGLYRRRAGSAAVQPWVQPGDCSTRRWRPKKTSRSQDFFGVPRFGHEDARR